MPLAPSERKLQSRSSRIQQQEDKQSTDLSKRLSTSTPNLRQSPPRHHCGITDDDRYTFKATPIPTSSRELIFDYSLSYGPKKHFNDRQYSTLPPWEKDDMLFGPSKPFYPSGPNNSKRDDRIQRIKDARELYKTPRTRRETAGSVDDLLKDTKPPKHACSPRCYAGLGHQKSCLSASVPRLDLLKTPPSISPRISRKNSCKSSSSDNYNKKRDQASLSYLSKSREDVKNSRTKPISLQLKKSKEDISNTRTKQSQMKNKTPIIPKISKPKPPLAPKRSTIKTNETTAHRVQTTRSIMPISSENTNTGIQTDLYGFDIDETMRSANEYRNELTRSASNKKYYRSLGANTDIDFPHNDSERGHMKSQSDVDQSQRCDTLDNDQSTRVYNISVDSLDEITNSRMQESFNNVNMDYFTEMKRSAKIGRHDNQDQDDRHIGSSIGNSMQRSSTERGSNPFPILYADEDDNEDEMDDAEQVRDFHSSSEADSSILDDSSHQEGSTIHRTRQVPTKTSQYYLPSSKLYDIMSTSEENCLDRGQTSSYTNQYEVFADVPRFTNFNEDDFSEDVDFWVHKNIYYQTAPAEKSAIRDDINSFDQEVSVEISTTHELKNSGFASSKPHHAVSSIYYPMRADYSLPNTCVVAADKDSQSSDSGQHIADGSIIKVIESNVFSNFHLTLYPEEEPMMWKAGQVSVFTEPDSSISTSKMLTSRSSNSLNLNQLEDNSTIQHSSRRERNSFNRSRFPLTQTNDQRKSIDKLNDETPVDPVSSPGGSEVEEQRQNGDINGSAKEDEANGLDKRMDNLRNKFEAGESNQTSKQKQLARVRYAGLQSAKAKFIEDINRVESSTMTSSDRRAMRITPPRGPPQKSESENDPKPRDPNIIYSGEDNEEDEMIKKQIQTKNLLAKFKEMEQGKSTEEEKCEKQLDLGPGLAENNRNLRARWKDLEQGKSPETGRSRQGSETTDEIMVNARELRERFIKEATDSEQRRSTKLNPLEEIQELARREKNTIYENNPQARSDDIVSASDPHHSLSTPSTANAKQLREKFMNGNATNGDHKEKAIIDIKSEYGGVYENEPAKLEGVTRSGDADEDWKGNWTSQAKQKFIEASTLKKEKQKLQLDLGEGGIYESNPVRRENVVRSDSEEQHYLPTDAVKANKQRLMEWRDQNSQVKCSSGSLKFDADLSNGGVFENQPAQSQADISSSRLENDEQATLSTGKYASEAKRKFIEKQKQEEDDKVKRGPKQVINIWDDLCQDSGVFENNPTPPPKDITRCHDYEACEAYLQSQVADTNAVSQ